MRSPFHQQEEKEDGRNNTSPILPLFKYLIETFHNLCSEFTDPTNSVQATALVAVVVAWACLISERVRGVRQRSTRLVRSPVCGYVPGVSPIMFSGPFGCNSASFARNSASFTRISASFTRISASSIRISASFTRISASFTCNSAPFS